MNACIMPATLGIKLSNCYWPNVINELHGNIIRLSRDNVPIASLDDLVLHETVQSGALSHLFKKNFFFRKWRQDVEELKVEGKLNTH